MGYYFSPHNSMLSHLCVRPEWGDVGRGEQHAESLEGTSWSLSEPAPPGGNTGESLQVPVPSHVYISKEEPWGCQRTPATATWPPFSQLPVPLPKQAASLICEDWMETEQVLCTSYRLSCGFCVHRCGWKHQCTKRETRPFLSRVHVWRMCHLTHGYFHKIIVNFSEFVSLSLSAVPTCLARGLHVTLKSTLSEFLC